MLKTKILLVLFVVVSAFSSCKKDNYDSEKQAATDEALIKDFITKNSIVAVRHESGIYYQVIAPGSGPTVSVANTVYVNYEGRLLNGTLFDKANQINFPLSGVILGWQIGIPLIKKGGKIRLIIPSGLAYGNEKPQGSNIPKNSVLDFTVDLINAL
jgi:FKBP-type peptidyl-prolyl cis-trans isomerase FkpA